MAQVGSAVPACHCSAFLAGPLFVMVPPGAPRSSSLSSQITTSSPRAWPSHSSGPSQPRVGWRQCADFCASTVEFFRNPVSQSVETARKC